MDDQSHDDTSIKIVDSIITKFHQAIDNIPSSIEQLDSLISTFEDKDDIIELTEKLIHESDRTSDICLAEAISNDSSILIPHETPGCFTTWWSKVADRKSSHRNLIKSITSINSSNDSESIDDSVLNQAEQSIKKLENQGGAGLLHLSAISNVINKKILVWTSSTNLYHTEGNTKFGDPINVQYHSQPEAVEGHWTLLGNEEPNVEANLNDCLFATIAAQTGHNPAELRAATIARMKKSIRSLARRIKELAEQEKCKNIVLMVGGAKYDGKSARAAQRILDNSQQGRSHLNHAHGHPRGHASDPSARGSTESAENYSRGGWKTAFLSRSDQDTVAHLALNTSIAKRAMNDLNQGSVRQVVNIHSSQIPQSLPQGAHFNDGRMGNVENIKELVLVLQHFAGHHRDADHDVFVHTFYPKLR